MTDGLRRHFETGYGAPPYIVVTPAMVEAGKRVLTEQRARLDDDALLVRIFEAMFANSE